MGEWLFNQVVRRGYLTQERTADVRLRRALEEARNRATVSRADRQLLASPNRIYLLAVNVHARIAWARAFCREFSRVFALGPGRIYPDQQLYWVTLVDVGCITPHDAQGVDAGRFISLLRVALQGMSYIGMLDVAYYTNLTEGARYKNRRAMSWHIHLICWGKTYDEMQAWEKDLNRPGSGFKAVAEGLRVAKVKRIPRSPAVMNHLADKIRYMLKAPKDAYRLGKRERVTGDGEIVYRFKSNSSPLRPGERIRVLHATKHLYLDQMSLAGGEGVQILRRIKRRALQPLADAQKHHVKKSIRLRRR